MQPFLPREAVATVSRMAGGVRLRGWAQGRALLTSWVQYREGSPPGWDLQQCFSLYEENSAGRLAAPPVQLGQWPLPRCS